MKILFIQTSFLGDVILMTALVNKWKQYHSDDSIDVLIRNGNEQVFDDNPMIRKLLVWNKTQNKYSNLFKLLFKVREEKYDLIINLQRFFSTGLITVCGNAQQTIGFDKNPLSIFYSKRKKHIISTFQGIHETERNQNLIAEFTDDKAAKPVIYVSKETEVSIQDLVVEDYIVIAPASVWFTKQFPAEKWISFISKLDERFVVYLIGAKSDRIYCGRLIAEISLRNPVLRIKNISGDLSIKQSAALMKKARMNYVNDSAPLHIASAVNSPITAIFCSTVPSFGFGPLSDRQHIIEIRKELYCRPCGLHGYKSCPEKHFRCAYEINVDELLHTLDDTIQ